MVETKMLAFVIMREMHRHIDTEELEKYSLGSVSTEQTAHIEEHLLTCEACHERLVEADEYSVALRLASQQVRRNERVAEGSRWRFPSWVPVLAACGLLLVVAGVSFIRQSGPIVAVSLTAMRSSGAGSHAPAARELLLQPDLTGLAEDSSYRLEIVDHTGRTLRQGSFRRDQNGIKVAGLGAGQYFVRVYMRAGELLREYGLEIQ